MIWNFLEPNSKCIITTCDHQKLFTAFEQTSYLYWIQFTVYMKWGIIDFFFFLSSMFFVECSTVNLIFFLSLKISRGCYYLGDLAGSRTWSWLQACCVISAPYKLCPYWKILGAIPWYSLNSFSRRYFSMVAGAKAKTAQKERVSE